MANGCLENEGFGGKEKESVSTSREHEGCFLQSSDKERNERLMRDKMATCERLLESALFQAL